MMRKAERSQRQQGQAAGGRGAPRWPPLSPQLPGPRVPLNTRTAQTVTTAGLLSRLQRARQPAWEQPCTRRSSRRPRASLRMHQASLAGPGLC